MREMRILIAEDDDALAVFLRRRFEQDGHRVIVTLDGGQAVEAYRSEAPDLTILDLNLPVKDGEEALHAMRLVDPELPVLILTARHEIDVRIRCLDAGADDFLLKPFSLFELRARCRALLRRRCGAKLKLRTGDLEMDRVERTVHSRGKSVSLTNKEFALLEHLMIERGHCVSRTELIESVWRLDQEQTNIVDVYVNYLRRKLGDSASGSLIRTVRGKGYMIPLGMTEMEMRTLPGETEQRIKAC